MSKGLEETSSSVDLLLFLAFRLCLNLNLTGAGAGAGAAASDMVITVFRKAAHAPIRPRTVARLRGSTTRGQHSPPLLEEWPWPNYRYREVCVKCMPNEREGDTIEVLVCGFLDYTTVAIFY